MKNLTIWQRLNLAVTLLIFLLALGGGLAFWMERTQSRNESTATDLDVKRDSVVLAIARYNAALRGVALGDDQSELTEARKALENAITKAVPTGLATATEIRRELNSLEQASTNQAFAARVTASSVTLKDKFDDLTGEIRSKVEAAKKSNDESVTWVNIIATVGMALVAVAALFVWRLLSHSMTSPMQSIVESLEVMQRGDFTKRVQMERQDEFGVVGNGLNKLADELSVLVGQVQRSGIQVNSTATEISATAREQQSTANEIAATTAEIGATSKEISATSKELVKTMNEVSHVSEETADLAGSGQNAIGKMESTMRQIMDASGSITGKLAVLSEKTANINTVVTTITKVADQTNLLSLNAAIEAEKAGEYGLGFAVVAMEIRRLADQTAVATYDIEKMVKEMQSAVAAGVMGMDKFSEEVRRGVEEVRTVGTQLAQIIHQVQTLTPRFHTVNEGMHAQATGAQQISETLTQLNEAAQLTAESLRQSNIAIEQLNEAAHGLQTAVARFKLKA